MVPKYKWKKQPTIKDLCGISSCVEVKKKKREREREFGIPFGELNGAKVRTIAGNGKWCQASNEWWWNGLF